MGKKLWQLILLVVQIMITITYGAIIIHMTVLLVKTNGKEAFRDIQGFIPQFVILISSLVPQIMIRVRRKMHTQDGDIFPILFTMIALQATLIVPRYLSLTNLIYINPKFLIFLERFSLVGTASFFLLSSLRYYGFNSSKMSWYILIVLGFSAFISIIAPVDYTADQSLEVLFANRYDAIIQFAILLLFIASILTLLILALRERTAENTKRFVGFTLLVVGLYLGFGSSLVPVILSSLSYITGIVIISNNIKESF